MTTTSLRTSSGRRPPTTAVEHEKVIMNPTTYWRTPQLFLAVGLLFGAAAAGVQANSGGGQTLTRRGLLSKSSTMLVSTHSIDNILFVDGTHYAGLAAALAACPSIGCTIYDSLPETLSSNPFARCPAPLADITIYLSVNDVTDVGLVNSCSGLNIIGTGRSGSIGFAAGARFPSNTTLFTVGDGNNTHFVSGSRLQDLSLSCSGNTTCVPYVATNLSESSGVDHVAFTNYYGLGAQITAPTSTNFIFDDTVFLPSVGARAASGLQINRVLTDNNEIHRLTMTWNGSQQSGNCVDVESSSAHLSDIHCEAVTNGILVNNSHVVLEGYNTGNGASGTIVDNIKITGTGSLVGFDISACGPGYGTNLIHNTATSFTLAISTTCLVNYYMSGASSEGEVYFYPGIGAAGEIHTGGITASHLIGGGLRISTPPVATGAATFSGTGACAAISTPKGGSWSGQVTCTGTSGASTLVITPGPTAPGGFMCSGSDTTLGHELVGAQSGQSATTCTLKFSSVTANDVLSFAVNAF